MSLTARTPVYSMTAETRARKRQIKFFTASFMSRNNHKPTPSLGLQAISLRR